MGPLDLRTHRPRPAHEKVAGIVFTARVIDKLRATLPGGNLNGYYAFQGVSEMWKHGAGISLRELSAVVRDARDEAAIERWILSQTKAVDKPALNAALEGLTTDRIPISWRETFERTYPQELRERFRVVFDLLEADDERLYQHTGET